MNDELAKELIAVLCKIEISLDEINSTLDRNQGGASMSDLLSTVDVRVND